MMQRDTSQRRLLIFSLAMGVVLVSGNTGHAGAVFEAQQGGISKRSIVPGRNSMPISGRTGGTILFSEHDHWYTIEPNGTHRRLLLSSTGGCAGLPCATFSPDGTRVMAAAFTSDKRVTTVTIRVNGSEHRALPLPDRTLNLGPGAWSRTGARVALEGWDDLKKGRTGIYTVNPVTGAGLVRLTRSADRGHDIPLLYSPDGSRLLFFHDGQTGGPSTFGTLFEITANGSSRIQLNPSGTWVGLGIPATWSPDGKHITFTAFAGPVTGQSAVFVADANGTHVRRITSSDLWSMSAHWSPTGTWIVFDKVDDAAGNHDLFVVHPDGTGLRRITTTIQGYGNCCAQWSPDGEKLLFHRGSYLWTMNPDGSGLAKVTRISGQYNGFAWGP